MLGEQDSCPAEGLQILTDMVGRNEEVPIVNHEGKG